MTARTGAYEALTLTLEAGETQQFNSTDLELGNPAKGLTGSTGAGDGDWRLELRSELDLEVLSYVRTVGGQGYVTPMHDTAAREAEGLMRYYVPIFHAAEYEAQESRLHLFNAGEAEARVGIAGLDDAGLPPPEGDVSLVLGAGETRVVTAEELENGGEGLDGWFGSGAGRWRLLVSSGEALQVMSLGYGADGFLANLSRGSPPAYAVQSGAPDLVVETLSVSDGTPDSGETFTLSAMVRNRGDGDAEATTLRYYRSTNANISASDLEVGTVRVDALSASGSGNESIALAAPSEAGTYYYGACADPVADESDIANNCSAAVPLTVSEQGESSYPDLVVSRPTVSKDATRTGEAFTLSATVRNAGAGASPATTLRYYRSTDDMILRSDTEVDTRPVIGLGTAGSSGESTGLTAPASPGTYYYGACVDVVAEEEDVSNNCSAAVAVTVTVPRPNLTVGPPAVDTASPDPGAAFELSVSVANDGDGDAGATRLNYYRSADAVVTAADTPVGSDALAALAAGDQSGESIPLTAPDTAGTYYYGACVEPVSGESDTTDNCSSSVAVTVVDPTPVFPDLVVGTPTVSENRPVPGSAFELTATVHNTGGGASNATTLRYYRSTDAVISTSDTPVDTAAVGALAASGTSRHAVTVTAPAIAGTYYYGACVDTVADESDAGNNCSVGVEIGVEKPLFPDLVVGAPAASENTLQVAAAFTLSATVTNRGDGDAEATMLRYYRSEDAIITMADAQVGMEPVAELAASGTSAESIELTAPSMAGTVYYGACVDAVDGESDTTNNCSPSVAVAVEVEEPPGSDLVVGTPTVDNTSPTTGRPFTLSASVTNSGNGASPATMLRYYRSEDATIETSDTEEGTDAVGALSAAGTSPQSISLTAPWRLSFIVGQPRGTYFYGACVDEVDGESDNTNNCSSAVRVVVEEAPSPDLRVDTLSANNTNPRPEAPFTLSTEVENWGDGASPATTLRYYRSTDGTTPTSDTEVGTDPVNELPARQFQSGMVTISRSPESIELIAPAEPGTYSYSACVDPVMYESNTANNCTELDKKVFVRARAGNEYDISIPEGCPLEVEICVWDSRCEDGDEVQVNLNGSELFSTELFVESKICHTGTVSVGRNSLVINPLNGTGFKGECDHANSNSGAAEVRGSNTASFSWIRPAGVLVSVRLNIAVGEAGTCPGKG